MKQGELVPVSEMARRLGVTRERVRQMILEGKLEGVRLGRYWYVREREGGRLRRVYTFFTHAGGAGKTSSPATSALSWRAAASASFWWTRIPRRTSPPGSGCGRLPRRKPSFTWWTRASCPRRGAFPSGAWTSSPRAWTSPGWRCASCSAPLYPAPAHGPAEDGGLRLRPY